jgi:hypothetical protein
MLQILLVKRKFLITLKVFLLYLLVVYVMDGFLIRFVHFVFVIIEVGLILIKFLIILFY